MATLSLDRGGLDDSLWHAWVVDRLLPRLRRTRLAGDTALLLFSVLAIGCFAVPMRPWATVAGGLFYLLSTIPQRLDGLLRQRNTKIGPLRDLACSLALFLGQYVLTGHTIQLRVGIAVLTLIAYEQLHLTRPRLVRLVDQAVDDEEFFWWDWYCWYQRLQRIFLVDCDTPGFYRPIRPYGPVEFRLIVFGVAPLLWHFALPLTVAAALLLFVSEACGIVGMFHRTEEDPPVVVRIPEARRESVPGHEPEPDPELSEVGTL